MSTEEREESQPRPRKVIQVSDGKTQIRKVKEDLTIKVTTDLRETTMNGDHMTVRAGMTAAVIILMGITALLTETVRAVLVRMTTAKVVVITADHLITTVTTTVAAMEIIAKAVTATIVKVVTTQIAKVATTAVLLMATIAPLTATMTVRMVVAVPTTVLLVLTMTKDQADLILLRRKGMLLVTA